MSESNTPKVQPTVPVIKDPTPKQEVHHPKPGEPPKQGQPIGEPHPGIVPELR